VKLLIVCGVYIIMLFFDPTGKRRMYAFLGIVVVLSLVGGIVVVGSLQLRGPHTYVQAPVVHPDWSNPDFEKTISLTFDDGPHPDYTPTLLDLLEEHHVPATFFLMGEQVVQNPLIARDIVNRGFEIGNHSFTHARSVHESPDRIRREVVATDRAIATITGVTTILYRPPFLTDIGFGTVDGYAVPNANLRTVENIGLMVVGADIDPTDWETTDLVNANEVYAKMLAGVQEGKRVILLHDHGGEGATIEALRTFIPEMKRQGYRFVPVSRFYGLTREQVMPPTVRAVSHYPLAVFIVISIIGGLFLGIIGSVLTVITLLRMGVIVTARRFLVPWFTSEHRHERYANDDTLLIHTKHSTLRSAWPSSFVFREPLAVIIPAHNEAANIEATILSVMSSSITPAQVIVVDDGSTDETPRIVEHLAKEYYPHIKLVQKQNSGSKAGALRYGFEHVEYDIVVCIDADTIIGHQTLERLRVHFADPRVGAVAGKVYPATTTTLIEKLQYLEYVLGQNLDKTVFSLGNAVGIVPGAIGAWRKRAVQEVGGYSTQTVVEDQDLTLALLARDWSVRFEPEALAYTETPSTIQTFFKQRFRWVYGTVQCFYKYESWLFSLSRPWLGFVVLPNILLFNIVFPLLVPVVDGIVVLGLLGFIHAPVRLSTFAIYIALDIWYAGESLMYEKKPPYRLLSLVIVQRFFYRYVMAFALAKSIALALLGTFVGWGALHRRGAAAFALAGVREEGLATRQTGATLPIPPSQLTPPESR
jgi:cellulose synthase/poly-beta-1,6-N-acetylglucosamine synthase-like glycosyltransferase/peptidoglycan/xylan/chitin deacetylase (PgdA/CDA1 family)